MWRLPSVAVPGPPHTDDTVLRLRKERHAHLVALVPSQYNVVALDRGNQEPDVVSTAAASALIRTGVLAQHNDSAPLKPSWLSPTAIGPCKGCPAGVGDICTVVPASVQLSANKHCAPWGLVPRLAPSSDVYAEPPQPA